MFQAGPGLEVPAEGGDHCSRGPAHLDVLGPDPPDYQMQQAEVAVLAPPDGGTASPCGPWGDQPTPGLSTAKLSAVVEALAHHPGFTAFTAAIAARVFTLPAASNAEIEDVLMAAPADSNGH